MSFLSEGRVGGSACLQILLAGSSYLLAAVDGVGQDLEWKTSQGFNRRGKVELCKEKKSKGNFSWTSSRKVFYIHTVYIYTVYTVYIYIFFNFTLWGGFLSSLNYTYSCVRVNIFSSLTEWKSICVSVVTLPPSINLDWLSCDMYNLNLKLGPAVPWYHRCCLWHVLPLLHLCVKKKLAFWAWFIPIIVVKSVLTFIVYVWSSFVVLQGDRFVAMVTVPKSYFYMPQWCRMLGMFWCNITSWKFPTKWSLSSDTTM